MNLLLMLTFTIGVMTLTASASTKRKRGIYGGNLGSFQSYPSSSFGSISPSFGHQQEHQFDTSSLDFGSEYSHGGHDTLGLGGILGAALSALLAKKSHPQVQHIPVPVEKHIPVPVKIPVVVHVDRPYPVTVLKPYPVAVDKPYPVHIDRPVPVPVPQPVAVPVIKHVGIPVSSSSHSSHSSYGSPSYTHSSYGSPSYSQSSYGSPSLTSYLKQYSAPTKQIAIDSSWQTGWQNNQNGKLW